MDKHLPQYWTSLEELNQTPDFMEVQGKEFLSPPAEQVFSEIDRRSFLKIMGASALFATATACFRRPVEKIIPYVNRPEEVSPGIPNWYASTCGECAAGCGILIKTREGRPIKLEGNSLHPLNQGGLCAKGQASLLNLYDPERLKNPVSVSKNGSPQNLSLNELDEKIKAQIADLKSKGKKVAVLSGALNSPSTVQLIRDFISAVGSSDSVTPEGNHICYEGVVPEEIGLAHQLSYGEKIVPRYRFDQAKLVVSFGADFLGTWLSPVEFAKGFSKARKLGKEIEKDSMLRFIAVESALSLTGTNSDEYFSVKSGDELLVALALAHEIIVANKLSRYASDSQLSQALSSFDVQTVAQKTGLQAKDLKRVAKELWDSKNRSLIVGGPLKVKNALALQVVVNLLNSALENEGYTVDSSVSPSNQANSSYAGLVALIEAMNQEKIGALFIYKSNPIFTLPAELKFAEALKKIPLVVSFADRVDETASLANYVAPDTHYLESWNDASPERGVYSIAQPAISPMYQNRAFQESLIRWGDLPYKTWHDYIKSYWQKTVYPLAGEGRSFETFWNDSLKKGVVDPLKDRRSASNLSSSKSFSSSALKIIPSDLKQTEGYVLALYPSVPLFDGRSANNAWLQELPDPVSKVTWENYLSVSPEMAKNLNLLEGDVVRVRGSNFGVELPVYIQPKLNSKTVMVAVGYGHSQIGPVGNGVGVNVFPFQKAGKDFVEWSGQSITLEKTSKKEVLATTQRHHSMEGRPIIQEITFQELVSGSHHKKEEVGGHEKSGEQPTMWPVHEYKSYRWGMSIDLTSCVGCNGCMIGCQAENNIPVVGKQQVINGRSMHWIRIDRYFSGASENPKVVYQPMLCQHCENAPCETVCPTLATLHNDEGLNVQVYNRCVGTRYCANNCPYKVRRFNFFDYTKDITEPMSLVLNPDVTVRSRGVMEKCTFCIQRIAESKDHAKAENRKVKDGELKTACQQSCPANAIVFGDLNDPESAVSKLKESSRGYHVLEELNAKPQVTYLNKVRNEV